MKWAAVSLVALSALCVPTTLQAQDFTAASVMEALKGFGDTFRRSNCFIGRDFRPFQIAVAQMVSTKFTSDQDDTISEWIEEALASDPFLIVAAQRRAWELAEISKALGESKSPSAKDSLDGIITINADSGRTIAVVAYAYANGGLCRVGSKNIAVGKIVEAPDVPEKFFERAAKKLPATNIDLVVVMPPVITGIGGVPARVMAQQLQEQLGDSIKEIFQTRASLSAGNATRPDVRNFADGMDVSRAWQARLHASRSSQGGVEVRVEFRSPPDSQSGSLTDRGYLGADIIPTESDPGVVAFVEEACRSVRQAIDSQSDPDALQALAREGQCPRLGKELAEKERFHRDRICSEERARWNEAARQPIEAMETVAGTLRCKQVADDAQNGIQQRKAREAAITDMKSNAVDLGPLTDGGTVERKASVGGSVAVGVWKFQMTEADTLEAQFDLTGSVNVELLDSSWNPIAVKPSQVAPRLREINTPDRLKPGAYYIRVTAVDGKQSAFTLRVAKGAIDTAGDTIETARDLGSLGLGEQTIRKRVGGADKGDVYKFTAQERLRLRLAAGDMTSDVQLDLLNQGGQVILSRRGRDRQSVEWTLEPRSTYYVAVKPAGDITPYSLGILLSKLTPFSHPDTAAEASIAGPRSPEAAGAAPSILRHSVTANDAEYYARFSLKDPTPVSIDLTWQDRQAELELDLFKEEGGRRPLQRRVVAPNVVNQKISDRLDPGTYLLRVKRNAGPPAETPFTLSLHEETSKPGGAVIAPSGATPNPAQRPPARPGGATLNPSSTTPVPGNPVVKPGGAMFSPGGATPKPGNATSNPLGATSNLSNPASQPVKEAAATLMIGAEPFVFTLPANENDFSRGISVTERSKIAAVLNWDNRAVDLDMELKDASGKVIVASNGTVPPEKFEPVLEPGTYTVHVYRALPTSTAAVPLRLTLNKAVLPPARSSSAQR